LNVIENVEQKKIEEAVYYLNSDIGNEYFYGDIVLWKLRFLINNFNKKNYSNWSHLYSNFCN